ncbi:hydroxyisourate hydrolase [Microbacterium sp. G2-8]|uniref:hydroxyisourate hydrolase n=1 Tax=Microbacterium sp. G2-8 TaxID=2842454 RepID=UPI001C8A84B0|nr:hydroxyisourate hydrolase [Microbacterium sp. G2-8]
MPHLTTHVLDAAQGAPAPGIRLSLTAVDGTAIADGVTDDDGRAGLGPDVLDPGDYTLRFETRAHFEARGIDAFYPFVTVTFTVSDDRHCHVPILLSPFAYSTYRGS